MATKSFPYVSVSGDRKITASDEAQGFDLVVASGVVPGYLNTLTPSKVTGALSVSVASGAAVVGGRRYIQDTAEQVSIDAGNTQPRIDIIALESNSNTPVRASRLVVIKGTPAASPVAPALTNTSAISQIELCRVLVPADATTLSSATLTDTRTYVSGRHAHAIEGITGLQTALNGKAASSHNHNAADVTAGTLPIARGGTGATTAAAARAALGAAANTYTPGRVLVSSAVQGVVVVSSTTSSELSRLQGLSSNVQAQLDGKSPTGHKHSASDINAGTLPIARGGTGATSASGARSALGAASSIHFHEIGHVAGLAETLNSKELKLSDDRKRKITISTSNPSGGTDGDVWIKYS